MRIFHFVALAAGLTHFIGSVAANTGPPIESLYGAYEIVGKYPGANGDTYRGWARFAVEEKRIDIVRCLEDQETEGTGLATTVGADGLFAVQMFFTLNGDSFEATCKHASDFDNLPRFTCYTYPINEKDIDVPGLEAYFPIVWPVPQDFFECHE